MRSINRTVGLCVRTKNKAFTSPTTAPEHAVSAAVRMCQVCPLLQSCAKDALQAGGSLDRAMRAPASDVLQAGVHCRGDQGTARQLAAVAGVDVPIYRSQRTKAPTRKTCVHCGTPMVPSGYPVPEGHVSHYARGYGTCCRTIYLIATAGKAKRETVTPYRRAPKYCVWCHYPMVSKGHTPAEGGSRA